MDSRISRKLDAFRFFAALAVVAAHASQLGYAGPGSGALVGYGRLGVVAFFVLSGYVIAFVCDQKHDSGSSYAIARLARLHSVLVPALLLTWISDAVGGAMMPQLYSGYPSPWEPATLLRMLAFPIFMNQSFGHDVRWLSNGPLWSIAYEFWYYAIFGVWHFLRGRIRMTVLTGCAVLAGPKILLLLPLWLSGVVVYRQRHLLAAVDCRLASWMGCTGLAILLVASSSPGWRATEFLRDAGTSVLGNGWSSFALWDLAILAPLCMVMLAVTHPLAMNPGERAGRALQFLAGGTFSIYCFHAPLILLLRSSGAYAGNSAGQALLAAMLVVAACLGLSMLTERRKAGWVWFWTKMIHRKSGVIRHA